MLEVVRRRGKGRTALVAIEAPAFGAPRPGHSERLFRGERRPRLFGNDADAVGEADDLDDAGNGACLRIVNGLGRRALHRRAQHRAVEHVWRVHVDAVLRFAVNLARQLDAHDIVADEAEAVRRLQLIVLHFGRLRGNLGEGGDCTVVETAPGFFMDDNAGAGGQLGDRYIPMLSGVLQQHLAHLRAKLAHRREVFRHRVARRRVHVAEARIGIERVIGWRRQELHFGPVGVEFLGKNARDRGERAFAHLDRGRHDRNRSIGRDGHPGIDNDGLGGLSRRRDDRADRKAARNRKCQPGGAHHEAAAADRRMEIVEIRHGFSPPVPRVRWRERCAGRCRSGRYSYSYVRRSELASDADFVLGVPQRS